MFSKILAPVDGSKNATKALNAAIEVAQMSNAELLILSVIDEPHTIMLVGAYASMTKALEENAQNIIKQSLKAAAAKKVKSRTIIEKGHVSSVILQTAENEKVDLIVIGRRGLSKIASLLIGSVSSNVVHNAKCSVLVVK